MVELKITGMNCHHCVRAVEEALKGVPRVIRVERVELLPGRALVEGDADPQALLAAIKEAGYAAELVTE
ncbi:MAG: cation transporter [Chromatiaceae bacterium]|jgi:copper chaperone CopZ|nr:cation transporter [Chromatiaceae bacterium]